MKEKYNYFIYLQDNPSSFVLLVVLVLFLIASGFTSTLFTGFILLVFVVFITASTIDFKKKQKRLKKYE